MIQIAKKTKRIILYHGFESIVKQASQVDVFQIIASSVQYNQLKVSVYNKVIQDFEKAQSFVNLQYEKCRMIEDDSNWMAVEANRESFLKQEHTTEYTKSELQKLKSWEQSI